MRTDATEVRFRCTHCGEEGVLVARVEVYVGSPAIQADLPELSVRATNCLQNGGLWTVNRLCQCTPVQLLKCRNLGLRTLCELRDALAGIGRHLEGDANWLSYWRTCKKYDKTTFVRRNAP